MRFGLLAGAVFLCACRQQNSQQTPVPSTAGDEEIPVFANEIAQLDDGGLAEFLEENANQTVYLDITIPQKEFEGGQEKDFAFFTVYDECPEDLRQGERPNRSKCDGTEYQVPKNALVHNQDGYKLMGNFRPTEKAGPDQGLFSVKLTPQP